MPDNPVPPTGEIILYQTNDGKTRVECRFAEETLWLSQALIAELFQKDVRTINEHLQNIYEEGELDPGGTIRKFRIVRREGTREVVREIEHYNLGRGTPLNNSVGMKGDRAIRKGPCGDPPALTLPGIGEFPGCSGQPSRNKPGWGRLCRTKGRGHCS